MNKRKFDARHLVKAALFTALVCVATVIVQIPSPMNGYVNLGDCFVLLSGWFLGWSGALAAAIGSLLADIFAGYAYYAPGTFIIKGLVAITAFGLHRVLTGVFTKNKRVLAGIISATAAEAVMVIGYYIYSAIFFEDWIASASSIPGNIVQGVVGIVSATLLYECLKKVKYFNQ